MVGHAIVNTSKVFVVLRKRPLSVFWATNQFKGPSAELLGPLRMFFFDNGSLLEEDGKILTKWLALDRFALKDGDSLLLELNLCSALVGSVRSRHQSRLRVSFMHTFWRFQGPSLHLSVKRCSVAPLILPNPS
jgi:hypothetical protein